MVKVFHRLSRAGIRGKRVLLRVDFNVPIGRGRVLADFRIRVCLPVIRFLLRNRSRVIFLSHHSEPRRSLRPVSRHLAELLGVPVRFAPNLAAARRLGSRTDARLVLLENLRRWPGEVRGDRAFAARLAALGDVFVNDAFAVAHRRSASLTVLPRLLPSFLGPRFARELKALSAVLARPRRPLVALFGGVKVETKAALLRRFLHHADRILLGSALAGSIFGVGRRPAGLLLPRGLRQELLRSERLVRPLDLAVAVGGRRRVRAIRDVASGEAVYDIGPRTVRRYRSILRDARTIFWNGPVGLVERKPYARGTQRLAAALARSRATTIAGGGDTVAYLERRNLTQRFTYLSTGGGAMLAFLAGEKLPALEALQRSKHQ